jgi:hypothetical protein
MARTLLRQEISLTLPRTLGMTIKALRAVLTRHPGNVHQALPDGGWTAWR